jgi:microsomal dipeptidase-like Zn-dependent dipeptidase
LSAIAAAVRQVGSETTVLATDFGQPENPSPVEGLQRYIAGLMELGIGQTDIDRMVRTNPAWLLGL